MDMCQDKPFFAALITFPICKVDLYAADTLLYQAANTIKNAEEFQSDINAVNEWPMKWMMSFSDEKCQAIQAIKKWQAIQITLEK